MAVFVRLMSNKTLSLPGVDYMSTVADVYDATLRACDATLGEPPAGTRRSIRLIMNGSILDPMCQRTLIDIRWHLTCCVHCVVRSHEIMSALRLAWIGRVVATGACRLPRVMYNGRMVWLPGLLEGLGPAQDTVGPSAAAFDRLVVGVIKRLQVPGPPKTWRCSLGPCANVTDGVLAHTTLNRVFCGGQVSLFSQ